MKMTLPTIYSIYPHAGLWLSRTSQLDNLVCKKKDLTSKNTFCVLLVFTESAPRLIQSTTCNYREYKNVPSFADRN